MKKIPQHKREQIEKRYPHELTRNIAKDLDMDVQSVYNYAHNNGIKKTAEFLASDLSGRKHYGNEATQFKPGNIPHNKGKKIDRESDTYAKMSRSFFQKGMKPTNWKPEGTISIRWDNTGRVYQYIKHEGNFVLLHRLIWEQANGPIPKKHKVTFKDGNSMNCDLSNLEMMTFGESMKRNTIARYPLDIQQVIRLKAKINKKIEQYGKKQDQ